MESDNDTRALKIIIIRENRVPGLDYADATQLSSRDWAGQQAQYPPLRTMTTDRL